MRLGSTILSTVRADLSEIQDICRGHKKQTNQHREIAQQLLKGVVPASWKRFSTPTSVTVSSWAQNLAMRLEQLQEVIGVSKNGPLSLRGLDYWIGGLFNPDAFITATRQCVAQANFWSLEDLRLRLTIGGRAGGNKDGIAFGIKSLRLYGAQCREGTADQLTISRSSITELGHVGLQWQLKSKEEDEGKEGGGVITLPVYLNSERSEILVNVDFALDASQDERVFVETGVAFLANP